MFVINLSQLSLDGVGLGPDVELAFILDHLIEQLDINRTISDLFLNRAHEDLLSILWVLAAIRLQQLNHVL